MAQPPGQGGNGPTPYQLSYPDWASTGSQQIIIPVDNPLTVEGIALGRKLFDEKALSDDYSMSCATCHQQEFAFTDPRVVSLGTDGSPGRRNSMAITNPAWEQFFFWDGRAPSLEMQALGHVANMVEMRNTWPEVESRLAAHPGTLALRTGIRFARGGQHARGESHRPIRADLHLLQFPSTVMNTVGIAPHLPPRKRQAGTSTSERPNATFAIRRRSSPTTPSSTSGWASTPMMRAWRSDRDRFDLGKFKTNTMRNIEVTGPYMHDGRFATLEEVVDFYADSISSTHPTWTITCSLFWTASSVDADERAALVAFLKTLTDTEFLNNPAFSDPN